VPQPRFVAPWKRIIFAFLFIGCGIFSPSAQAAKARTADYIAGHYVAGSPMPELRTPSEAATLARECVRCTPGAFLLRGQGRSMQPLYASGTLLVVQPQPYETLERGMTVVFTNDENRSVTHVLVAKTGNGWRTTGLNNRRADYIPVNASNIKGVVIAAFTPVSGSSVAVR